MLAKTVQSCLNGWSVCFGDAVARNAPLQLQLRRRSGQPCFFRSIPLSGLHARGAIALPPRQKKARLGPRASHSRAAWHLDPHAHVGARARAMQPNTAQQHTRRATRTGMAGGRRVCFRRGGRELPARAVLGINLGGGGSARACAYACICGYADARPRVQSPGIKPAACAFVGAEAVRWPRPRSAQKEACGACENPAAA